MWVVTCRQEKLPVQTQNQISWLDALSFKKGPVVTYSNMKMKHYVVCQERCHHTWMHKQEGNLQDAWMNPFTLSHRYQALHLKTNKDYIAKTKRNAEKEWLRNISKSWLKEKRLCSLAKGWERNMINVLPVTWNVAERKRMVRLSCPWRTEYKPIFLHYSKKDPD